MTTATLQAGACVPQLVPHGGPDASGVAQFDFSTNGNAAGPLPSVEQAVTRADRSRYPDPDYYALAERLAAWHGVDPARIVVAGSASEFIHRFSRFAVAGAGVQRAVVPNPGYGDYAAAATLAGIETVAEPAASGSTATDIPALRAPSAGDLCWITEPANPTGRTRGGALGATIARALDAGAIVALDLAYQPLRFDDQALAPEAEHAWQVWSPNKACGLTGVRAAYAIAPRSAPALALARALRAHAASWVAGADGVAMLTAFATPAAQAELALRLPRLRAWRDALALALRGAGWRVEEAASVTPFFVARAPGAIEFTALRARGIKLRPTDSMGLAGWVRLSARPPDALAALLTALRRAGAPQAAEAAR